MFPVFSERDISPESTDRQSRFNKSTTIDAKKIKFSSDGNDRFWNLPYHIVIHSPKRLMTPLRRIGKKGIGLDQFAPISWDEALDRIVENFKYTIDTYGSESILRYSYAGTMGAVNSPAADYFFRCIGATSQDRGICSPAKQAAFKSVYGDTGAIKPQEAQHSD